MKTKVILMWCILVCSLGACRQSEAPGKEAGQEYLLQATVWYQHSAEMKALYYQAFNWAGRTVAQEVALGSDRPLAVVLDIDETVLDNSPQTGRQILEGVPFSAEMWDSWCRLEEAEALPGVLEFTRGASALGVKIFYISNRGEHLMDCTLANLEKLGFPNADREHVLLKTTTSVKDPRRSLVRENHDVILLIGDNLGDFSGVFDERLDGNAGLEVKKHQDMFGFEFVLLPNPMYGSWEKPFRGDSPSEEVKKKKDALRTF